MVIVVQTIKEHNTSNNNSNGGTGAGDEGSSGGTAGGSTGESLASSFFGGGVPPRPPSQALDGDKDKDEEDAPRESMFSFGSSSGMGMSRALFTSPSAFMNKDLAAKAKEKDDKEGGKQKEGVADEDANKAKGDSAPPSNPADADATMTVS